ncbi:MAG: hydantoinase B/oxoprolinase family protein, partial [Alphaproteobacteria bacterium]
MDQFDATAPRPSPSHASGAGPSLSPQAGRGASTVTNLAPSPRMRGEGWGEGRPRIDPARFEVVKNALISAAEEMKIVLAKTAYSPLLNVAGDYSCGIFDAHGNMVALGPDLPIHLGSMPDAVRA